MMSEMENTADHLIVIGKGRLIADCPMGEFIARSTQQAVRARTPQPGVLARAVSAAGGQVAAVPARPGAGLAGGGVHGADRRQRRIPGWGARAAPARARDSNGGMTMAHLTAHPGVPAPARRVRAVPAAT